MHGDLVLRQPKFGKALPRSNSHLRLHEVNVGNFLGDGVLYLDAWVHFNEHVLTSIVTDGVD